MRIIVYPDHSLEVERGYVTLWEHDTQQPYRVPRHAVAPIESTTWRVTNLAPLSVAPSLYCSPDRGGCGRHGSIVGDRWL